jgi:hypothetical protein
MGSVVYSRSVLLGTFCKPMIQKSQHWLLATAEWENTWATQALEPGNQRIIIDLDFEEYMPENDQVWCAGREVGRQGTGLGQEYRGWGRQACHVL